MKAIGDFVILKKANKNESSSGLLMPISDLDNNGEIVAVGDSVDIDINVGDIIYFARGFQKNVSYDGVDYIAIKAVDVLFSI
jgi:co-chaperonin GroES (HSP10)